MFLFQLFLLMNLGYLLLLSLGLLLIRLIYPMVLQVLSTNWLVLLIVLAIGLFLLNWFFWSYRYFFYWFKFKNNLFSYSQFLHKQASFKTGRVPSKDKFLALQVHFSAGQEDYINELLTKQEGIHCSEGFVLTALGYYLIKGKFREGSLWLTAIKTPRSFSLACTRVLLNFLQTAQLADRLEVLKTFNSLFCEKKYRFKPKGYRCLRIINLYLWQLVFQDYPLLKARKELGELAFKKSQKDFLKFKRYPLYFTALSFFWTQAVSSLFNVNSIE